ncbi:hypothetical protein ACFL2T_04790 [Elusimicrobiota bacterium]
MKNSRMNDTIAAAFSRQRRWVWSAEPGKSSWPASSERRIWTLRSQPGR